MGVNFIKKYKYLVISKSEKKSEKIGVAGVLDYKNDIVFSNEKSVALGGWIGVCKAVLRIA